MKGYRRLYNRVRHDHPHDHPHGHGHVRGERHGASAGCQTGAREKSIRRHCAHRPGAGVQTRCHLEKQTRCLRYTKQSERGLPATAKKENRFFIETHTPQANAFSVYPQGSALIRPSSLQIRDRQWSVAQIVQALKEMKERRFGVSGLPVKSRLVIH